MRAVESSPTPAQTLLFPEKEHLRGHFNRGGRYVLSTGTGENMREPEFNEQSLLKRTLRLRC
jgi:hypothetical protein